MKKCVGAGAALKSPLLPHRLDESPTDYSSASCSPAELASASSDELIVQPWPRSSNRKTPNGQPYVSFVSHSRGSVQGGLRYEAPQRASYGHGWETRSRGPVAHGVETSA